MDLTDPQLVQLSLDGDQPAFGALVKRYAEPIRRFLWRLVGDHGDAEDLAQETFLQAFLGLQRLEKPDRFKSWLYGIAANLGKMRLRSRKVTLVSWDALNGGAALSDSDWHRLWAPSAEVEHEVRYLHERVHGAIATLPGANQEAVWLFYFDGLSLQEIGVLLGVPSTTVKGRLYRARAQLRDRLLSGPGERAEQEVTPMALATVNEVPVVVEDVMIFATEGDDETLRFVEERASHRVVLLKERAGERYLPIWIGSFEGDVIAMRLDRRGAARPLTHDLIGRLLETGGMTVKRAVVRALESETYYATLVVEVGGAEHKLDARPSDAVAIALGVGAPITVAADVFDRQSKERTSLLEDMRERSIEGQAQCDWVMPGDPSRRRWVSIRQPAAS